MTTTKTMFLAVALMLTAGFAQSKEIVIDKKTKQIQPALYINQFEIIDHQEWFNLEKLQAAGKPERVDSVVMMCDDTYYSLVEISFVGEIGKDVTVESDCRLEGAFINWGDNFLHFNGPDNQSCTIRVQKKQNGKTINMNYELHDAC